MMQFVITGEEVEKIKDFLKNRNTLQVKKTLNELKVLEEEKPLDENSLRNKLDQFLRNKGRSSILESDIKNILNITQVNVKEDKKMAEDETKEEEKEEESKEEEKEE